MSEVDHLNHNVQFVNYLREHVQGKGNHPFCAIIEKILVTVQTYAELQYALRGLDRLQYLVGIVETVYVIQNMKALNFSKDIREFLEIPAPKPTQKRTKKYLTAAE